MTRRIIEIILGIIIAFCVATSYSDSTGESRLIIWYILTPTVLKAITWLALFFIAGSLIFGKNKGYTKYVYNAIVNLFVEPKKRSKPS